MAAFIRALIVGLSLSLAAVLPAAAQNCPSGVARSAVCGLPAAVNLQLGDSVWGFQFGQPTPQYTRQITIQQVLGALSLAPSVSFGLGSSAVTVPSGGGNPQLIPLSQFGNSLFSVPTGQLIGNITGSTGPVAGIGASAYFDNVFGSATGSLLYRSSTGWTALAPGLNGQLLAMGASVPEWAAGSGGGSISSIAMSGGITPTYGTCGGTLAGSGNAIGQICVNTQAGTTYTIQDADNGTLDRYTNSSAVAVTLPQAGAASHFLAGWRSYQLAGGAGVVTITPTVSTIDGASSLVVPPGGGGVLVVSDGTNYYTVRGSPSYTQVGTGVALGTMLNVTRTEGSTPATQSATMASLTDNVNFADGGTPTIPDMTIISNVNGDGSATGPKSNVYPLTAGLNENALASTLSTPGLSQDRVVQSNVTKTAPSIPAGRKMRDATNWWSQYFTANLPTSKSGADVVSEHDFMGNGLDDAGTRPLEETVFGLNLPLANGGFPASANVGRYLATSNADAWFHNLYQGGGNFSHAGLDLKFLNTASPVITSATPVGPVHSVTVDNVMPLESGGTAGGGSEFPVASTAAVLVTATAAVTSGTTITVSDASALVPGMFVQDETDLTGVPAGSVIVSIAGSVVTIGPSVTGTVGSGDSILFSRAVKNVTINGNDYLVAGIALDNAGAHTGTVYFYNDLTIADATSGVAIVPNTHAIWLCDGSASAPWCDISFSSDGTATIRGDGAGGVAVTGTSLAVPGLVATIAADQSTMATDNRPNMFQTTLTPATTTTNVWENNSSFLTLNGPGTATGEINLGHSGFTVASGAIENAAEGYQASLDNSGTVGSYFGALANVDNHATGTATTLYGFKAQFTNDNTTAATVGTWAGFDCEAKLGAGSVATTNACLRNGDANSLILSAGKMSIGSLTVPTATLRITGSDSSSGTNALKIVDVANAALLTVNDAGGILAGANPMLSGSGIVSGDCPQYSGTSGLVVSISCTGGGGGSPPGGASGSIQFNSAGSFGGFILSGDASVNTGTGAWTNTKVNGVAYGASPGTNTVPVVTGSNTVTYEALPVAAGGTGQTSYTNGQLNIGNTTTGLLTKATITAGSNITVTNAPGSITIASTAGGGNVTGPGSSVDKDCASFNGTSGLTLQDSGGRCVIESATKPGDVAYTILATDYTVATTTLTASRIWTLPAASAVTAGHRITIVDMTGVVGSNTITITAAGADTVNGGATFVLGTQYGAVTLQSDGISKWTMISSAVISPFTPVTHQFLTGLGAGGTFSAAQPALADISGTSAVAMTNTAQTFTATQTFGTIGGYLASVTTQAGAHTMNSGDCGTVIKETSASAVTFTLANSLPIGCQIAVEQDGAGQVTFSAAAGATLHSSHAFTKTFGQWAMVGVTVNANSGGASAIYILSGDGA